MAGQVEAIHVTDASGTPMRALDRATVRAGVGIDGDRYAVILDDGEIAVGDAIAAV